MAARTVGAAARGEISTGQHASLILLAETNILKARPGKVGQIVISEVGSGATLSLYDDADSADATKLVWTWATADGKGIFAIQMPMGEGIYVVTAGTLGRIVVVWS